MLTVIKRSGKEEPFNIDKIKFTLGSASDEIKEPLTSGDINLIGRMLLDKIDDLKTPDNKIKAEQVYEALLETLKENFFHSLEKAYRRHAK